MFWRGGVGDFMNHWNGENAAPSGVAPGSTFFVPSGGAKNAISQNSPPGGDQLNLNNDYTATYRFDYLIVRGPSGALNLNGSLDILTAPTSFQLANASASVNHNSGHTFSAQNFFINSGTYNLNSGGSIVVGNAFLSNNSSDVNFGTGGNGQNVSLTAAGRVEIDNANNNPFIVGSGSSLTLGATTDPLFPHIFADGLIVSDGSIGTGDNSAAAVTLSNSSNLSLENQVTIDYSINGDTGVSDEWVVLGNLDLSLLNQVDLVVDAVAGSIGLTDGNGAGGPGTWNIFSWSGGGGPSEAEFNLSSWNISVTENTRLGAPGTVEYFGTATTGAIYLTGFSAFAIPEPSTGMLIVIMSTAILIRRYSQGEDKKGKGPLIFSRL